MTASTYGRANDVPMVNKSGGQVILGDVVIYDTTNNLAFTTTTSASNTLACGVVQETIASNGTGRVRTIGYTSLVNVNASVTRGHYGATYTVAKQATDAGASRVAGAFIYFSTGGTTPDGIVYPVDLAGAALTNPMTTGGDVIYGGVSGTPTRLANGTAGQVLESAGGTSAPVWQSFSGAKAYTTGVSISNAVITFSAETYDTDSYHSVASATSKMVVPTTDYYLVEASGFVGRTDARISIYVNGAIVRSGNTSGASAGNYASAHGMFSLTAADYVEIFANTTTATTFGDNGSIGDNFSFTITRMRA